MHSMCVEERIIEAIYICMGSRKEWEVGNKENQPHQSQTAAGGGTYDRLNLI